jgi:hypothetical protein
MAMMRRNLGIGVLGLVTGAAATAHAQSLPMVAPVYGPPRVTWIGPPGDATGAAAPPQLVLEPIRSDLIGMTRPAHREPGCAEAAPSTGSATAATSGHPLQHVVALELVPRLTLFGFSRAGCALESSAGAALVYAAPIRRNIFLTGSAGILHLPHNGPGGSNVRHWQLRGDVVFVRPEGRSYSVGVGVSGARTTLTFGGIF